MTTDYPNILYQQATASSAGNEGTHNYLIPLPSYGVIQVTGEEAASFLQNLLTNDVNQLSHNQCQMTAMCNPKGRLLALFYLLRIDNAYRLVLPKTQVSYLAQRLQMFKLRSKVDITDASEDLQICGLIGDKHVESATPIPSSKRSLLLGKAEQLASEIDALLKDGWQLATENCWQIADIESGTPLIVAESRELFTAQQLNLVLIGAVNFRKGCYPGQEVVARLHYLGEPKRRLFHGIANTSQLPAIGETVFDGKQAVMGHIVNAVPENENQLFLQLSLKLEGTEQKLYLPDGTLIERLLSSAPTLD